MKPDCIFCKIIAREIPADIVYEDETTLGFLDINPKAPGHMLLIPKEHHAWIQDVPDTILQEMIVTTKKIIPDLLQKHAADYVKVSVVGVDVPHFHIHLIPQKI